jgi:phosphate:Na+ symporter
VSWHDTGGDRAAAAAMSAGWLSLLGGFGLLLFGIKMMSESLQVLAEDRLRRIISRVSDRPLHGIGAGVLVSAISQSSSLTTVMAVSFVNAGLMTMWQAAAVTLGANIGATVTAWVLALQLREIAVALVGIGALFSLFGSEDRSKFSGELALGFGLLFVGLEWLEVGCGVFRNAPSAVAYFAQLGAGTPLMLVCTVLLGVATTVLIPSSGAMIGVTIALATVGLIGFDGAAALVLGENVGSTMATQRAAVGTTPDSQRTAHFHTLINALGAIVFVFLFRPWMALIAAVAPGNPAAVNAAGLHSVAAWHIALAHTTFNVGVVLLALPLRRPLLAVASRMVRPTRRERPTLKFLRQSMVESPALAIEQCRLEVLHMADITADALHLTRQLFADATSPGAELRNRILKRERTTDTMQHAITTFMSRVMAGALTRAQSAEIRALIRVADEIESVADYCERLANYRRRLRRQGIVLGAAALEELQAYLDRTVTFYEDVVDRARRNETGWLQVVEAKAQYLASEADALRDTNLHRLAAQRATPGEGIFFNDLLVAIRRIRNHALNMAEAFLGQK